MLIFYWIKGIGLIVLHFIPDVTVLVIVSELELMVKVYIEICSVGSYCHHLCVCRPGSPTATENTELAKVCLFMIVSAQKHPILLYYIYSLYRYTHDCRKLMLIELHLGM